MQTAPKLLAVAMLAAQLYACGVDPLTPEESLAEARRYLADEDYAAAGVVLAAAVSENPRDPTLRESLSEVRFALGDFPAAEKELLRAQELRDEPAPEALPQLARILLAQYRFRDVIELEQTAPEDMSDKDRADFVALVGRAYLGATNSSAARTRLESALELNPESAEAMVGMGMLLWLERKPEEALDWAQRAQAAAPDSAAALNLLASVHRMLGNSEQALEFISAAIDQYPYIDLKYAQRALFLVERGDFPAARRDVAALQQSTFRNFWYTQYARGILNFVEENYQEAAYSFASVLEQNPRMSNVLFYAAVSHSRLGHDAQARQLADEALFYAGESSVPRGMLASVLIRSGSTERGYEVLEEVLQDNPDYIPALQALAVAYYNEQEYEKAIPLLEHLQSLDSNARVEQMLTSARIMTGEEAAFAKSLEDSDSSTYEQGFWKAVALLKDRSWAAAREQAQAVLDSAPDPAGVLKIIAVSHMAEQNWDAARDVLQQVMSLTDGSREAYRDLIALEKSAGENRAAGELLDELIKRHGDDLGTVLFAQAQFIQLDSRERARQLLDAAWTANPGQPDLRRALAGLNFADEDYPAVIALGEAMDGVELDADERMLELYGMALDRQGNQQLAVSQFRKMSELRPDSARYRLLLAETLHKLDRPGEADDAFAAALRLVPGNHYAVLRYLDFLVTGNQLKRAREVLDAFLESNPVSPGLLAIDGKLDLLLGGDYEQAEKKLASAYEEKPSADAAIWRSRILVLTQDFEAAIAQLDDWLSRAPDDFFVMMEKAGAYLSWEREAEALEIYRAVNRLYPDRTPVLNNIAWLNREVDLDYALATARRADQLQPNNAAVLDTLGYLQLRAGNVDLALDNLRRARQLSPGVPEVLLHLAEALAANDETAEAELLLKGLIESKTTARLKESAQQALDSIR